MNICWRHLVFLAVIICLASCAGSPPKKLNNACDIFDEKNGWYKQARKASKRWGTPISVNMAIMHQESRFVPKAKPKRTKILWVIPGPRKSSAYGYAQAKTETWKWYKKSSGHRGADRNDFDDAIDFIAWYNSVSIKTIGLKPTDAYSLYLAYHEGHGGFKRGTYKSKTWLIGVANKVQRQATNYRKQLSQCEKRLKGSWWPF